MNMGSMKEIQMYYIYHAVTIMWYLWIFMLFIHPLPWPHGTVKSPLTVHFRIRSEAVDHPGTFCLLFFTYRVFRHTTRLTYFFHILRIQTYYSFSILLFVYYEFGHTILAYFFARYEFGHTTLLRYCFSHTMNSDILLFWHTVFRILWIRTYYSFDILFFAYYEFRHTTLFDILFFAYYEFRHTTLLTYCFSHTMNSDILLFWHTVFRILWIRTYYSFDMLFFTYYEFGNTILTYCFSHTI